MLKLVKAAAGLLVTCISFMVFAGACGYRSSVPPPRPIPDVLPVLPPVQMVSTEHTTMVIGTDGTLWGKGDNIRGELGDGTRTRQTFFDQVGHDDDWAWVSSGFWQTAAIKADGSLWTWGSPQLTWIMFDHDLDNLLVPTQVGNDYDWKMVSVGSGLLFAIKDDGTLWGMGTNQSGGLEMADVNVRYSFVPIQLGNDSDWTQVFAARSRGYGVKADGSLWAWGVSISALPEHYELYRRAPERIGSLNWFTLDFSNRHTLGICSDGLLWAWGVNELGQLGDRTHIGRDQNRPVQVGSYSDWVSIAAGSSFSLGVREDGSLWVWGWTTSLFFGGLAERDKTMPTQIHPYEQWASVVAGGRNRAFAVTQDGRLMRLGTALLEEFPSIVSSSK